MEGSRRAVLGQKRHSLGVSVVAMSFLLCSETACCVDEGRIGLIQKP